VREFLQGIRCQVSYSRYAHALGGWMAVSELLFWRTALHPPRQCRGRGARQQDLPAFMGK